MNAGPGLMEPTTGVDNFDDGPQDVFAGDDLDLTPNPEEAAALKLFTDLVGGKAPTIEKVRLYGGAVDVANAPAEGFVKGRTYTFTVEAVCRKAGWTDKEDGKTGDVVDCVEERGLKIRSVSLNS